MSPCVLLQIEGRVQGVAYRASARRVAKKLQIRGYIRNNPDGSVTALACGSQEAINKFIAWCKIGPRFAHVTNVDVSPLTLPENEIPSSFEIRY